MPPDAVRLVIESELALLSPAVRRSAAAVEELLDPEFREVGASGRLWSRDEIVSALVLESAEKLRETIATELNATVLSPELVLLTYISERDGRRARRMSLWRRSAGTWRVLYHQGTPLDTSADRPVAQLAGLTSRRAIVLRPVTISWRRSGGRSRARLLCAVEGEGVRGCARSRTGRRPGWTARRWPTFGVNGRVRYSGSLRSPVCISCAPSRI